MMREECWTDIRSLEAPKIKPNHSSKGSQYFRKDRILDTAHGSKTSLARPTIIPQIEARS